jgi:hypothetical protein
MDRTDPSTRVDPSSGYQDAGSNLQSIFLRLPCTLRFLDASRSAQKKAGAFAPAFGYAALIGKD